jgi:hypothetical protein
MVFELWRLPEKVPIVGSERFGSVEEKTDSNISEYRNSSTSTLIDWGQVLPVFIELHERLVCGDSSVPKRLCYWFKRPDEETPGILFDIDAIVGIAKDWEVWWEIDDWFCHQIEVFTSVERNCDTNISTDLVRPHSGCCHHILGLHEPMIGFYSDCAPMGHPDSLG